MSIFSANPINSNIEKIRWQLLPAALFLLILPLNHTIALRFLCLLLAATAALRSFIKLDTPPLPLKLPLALWISIAALSLTWSLDPMFSLNELKTEIGYGMMTFFSYYVLTQSKREWNLLLRCLAGGVLASIIMALWANRTHLNAFQNYDWDWVHGFVSYSTYLVTALPLLVYLWLKSPIASFSRNFWWLLLPLFLFVGYATLNRMFWLSSGTIFLVWFGLWWFKHRNERRARPALLIGAASLLIMTLLFVTVAKQKVVDPLAAQPSSATTSTHIVSTFKHSERYEIWRFWLKRIAERPLTGVGFGRDLPHVVYADLKPKEWFPLMFAHAHNLFLDYAAQLGLGGLLALLYLFGAILKEFWNLYRSSHEEVSLIGICGIAIVIAMLSKNMTDDLFWRTDALLFWALMGMTLGYGRRLEKKQP